MRNPTIRSLPFPLALVSGSTATRIVLQSCSSSRRKSSGDQGCRKAAHSITITSSRSAGDIRRISRRARARTAISALRGHGSGTVERVEHPHRGPLAQVREQLREQPLVLLLREAAAQLLALRLRELLPPRRLVELALAELGRELEAVVQVSRDAQLAREDGADLLVGQLHHAAEGLEVRLGSESGAEARQERL